MMREFASVGYIVFDGKVAIPNYYNIAAGLNRTYNLENMVVPEYGVILPITRIYPDGFKIDRSFFESKDYHYYFGVIFATLDQDGYINEYYITKEDHKLQRWPVPIHHKRFVRSDSGISQGQLTRILDRSTSIEEAVYKFENITGIPSGMYNIYDRAELHKLAAGKLTADQVTITALPSQHKLIWLE